MREVILTHAEDLKQKNLRKVYIWYLGKLEAVGDIT